MGMVTEISIEIRSLKGPLDAMICSLQSLKKIHLSFTELHGNLPLMNNCSKLQYLNLTTNSLSGTLPDFSPLKSMQVLDLTTNEFTGEFSGSLGNLPELTILSFNQFFEEISPKIQNAKNLSWLIIHNNRFSGALVPQISMAAELSKIDAHNNLLTCPIPKEIGNPRLCAKISGNNNVLRVCSVSHAEKETNRMKLAAGFVIVAATGILVIGIILLRRFLCKQAESKEESSPGSVKTFHNLSFNAREISRVLLRKENVIGSGTSSTVYRVDLPNNEAVAVKQLFTSRKMEDDENSVCCIQKLPSLWPSMREIVKMLMDVDPCRTSNSKMVTKQGIFSVTHTTEKITSIYIHVCEYIVGSNLSLSSASSWLFSDPSAGIYVQNGCYFAGDGKSHGFLDSCWSGCLDGSPSFSFSSLNPVGEGFLPVGVNLVDDNAGEDMEVCIQGNLDIREEGNTGAWKGEKMHDLNCEDITLDLTLGLSNLKSFP
ncbi:hypothetical protein KI387_004868 [Taxus chinensis]|uniref:Uncharacterized protein n=1 Tax=Taxus chinensis TaxID=29808 RepID=A0AA38GQD8_TAXCH|nr:hypothetical protein KI387_004868 [Taxus chinensis]